MSIFSENAGRVSTQQRPPGEEAKMSPRPEYDDPLYRGSGKLLDRVALITGGDSGIGRAVALAFAKEGADVFLVFKEDREREDAEQVQAAVRAQGRQCLAFQADIRIEEECRLLITSVVGRYGRLDILVNNAGLQTVQEDIQYISARQLQETFQTNVFSMFFLVKAALPYLQPGSTIVNTASVTAYAGQPMLVDYAASKGAIIAFTRSLALQLAKKGIRVNAVAPGPIWTPLIVSSFPQEKIDAFGKDTPLGRAGQPYEVAPSYVFLASNDSSYMTGQVLHPNGGRIVNG